MAKRRTDEQLAQAIAEQQKRLERLRAEQRKRTKAEEAKINLDILDALREWNSARVTPIEWDKMAEWLRDEARKHNREKVTEEVKASQPYQNVTF